MPDFVAKLDSLVGQQVTLHFKHLVPKLCTIVAVRDDCVDVSFNYEAPAQQPVAEIGTFRVAEIVGFTIRDYS